MKEKKTKFGKSLFIAGLILLGTAIGIIPGYYAGDRGFRWLPTMLQTIILISLFAVSIMAVAQILQKKFWNLSEKGIRIRKRIIFFLSLVILFMAGKLLVSNLAKDTPLTSLSKTSFNNFFEQDISSYADYDRSLENTLTILKTFENIFDSEDVIPTPEQEQQIRQAWMMFYDQAFAMDQLRSSYQDWYRFDLSRQERDRLIKSFLITYASEVALFEKSSKAINMLSSNGNVVKFLNVADDEAGLEINSLSHFRQQLLGNSNLARIIAGRKYLKMMEQVFEARVVAQANNCGWLWNDLEHKLAYIKKESAADIAKLTIESDTEQFKRAVDRIWFPAQKGVAEFMGNTRFKQHGKYIITDAQREQMNHRLQPGDIILARKNWYLSNAGLPGFWPHAILYIGEPEKFAQYFATPEVEKFVHELSGTEMSFPEYLKQTYPAKWQKYLAASEHGKLRVIEAISKGVVFNSLEECIGDYAVGLRPLLSPKAKAQAIIQAFKHIGKPYDYNFDFATDDALVCTELVWRSYRSSDDKDGIDLQLKEIGGRLTLPANEIAKQYAAGKNSDQMNLEFVCFLDSNTDLDTACFADENDFLESCERPKWSFMQ